MGEFEFIEKSEEDWKEIEMELRKRGWMRGGNELMNCVSDLYNRKEKGWSK